MKFETLPYKGPSINKLQNGAIPLNLNFGKIQSVYFVRNLILQIHKTVFHDDVSIVTSSVHRTQSICVLFPPPVFYRNWQVLISIGTRKTNKLKKLMSPLQMLHISVSFSNISSKFFQMFVPSDPSKASNAAIVASVVATTCRPLPGRSLSTMLSLPRLNFVHQTCIAGLVKHLSPYTGRIWEWISFALSVFPTEKPITACCSLRDDFNGYVAIFNAYKWRHSDVIVMKQRAVTKSWIPYKMYISDVLYLEN